MMIDRNEVFGNDLGKKDKRTLDVNRSSDRVIVNMLLQRVHLSLLPK